MKTTLPDELTALNIRAWMHTHLHVCGCAEVDEVAKSLQRFLQWASKDPEERAEYLNEFTDVGGFYILSGLLNDADIIWHGTSCRCPGLTDDGERLLAAMEALGKSPGVDISRATGIAYDETSYQ